MSEFYTWQSPVPLRSMKRFLLPDGMRASDPREYLHQKSELGGSQTLLSHQPEKLSMEQCCGLMGRLYAEQMEGRPCSTGAVATAAWARFSGGTTTADLLRLVSHHDYYVERKTLYYGIKLAYSPLAICFNQREIIG